MTTTKRVAYHKGESGVITVEACIALPIFLCFFFLLLFLTRVACISLTLDQAASQTARHLAAGSYPLTFVNEYIDERMEDTNIINLTQAGSIKLTDAVSGELEKDSLAGIIWGGIKDDTVDELFQLVNQGLDEVIKSTFLTQYENLTNEGKKRLVGYLVQNYLDTNYVNPELLTIRLVELPKGEAEFAHRKGDQLYSEVGLIPEQDFTQDDVVIQLEYELKVPIPFFQDRAVKLRATAIERAWTRGGNGVYTKTAEGLDWLKQDQIYYYKARTGKKFHTKQNCAYLQKSCLKISQEEAEQLGLTEHANCPNRF